MPLLPCHRRQLLLLLLVAASHGDASVDTYDASMCLQETTCGNISIRYPFYFSNTTEDIHGYNNLYCGYPGLAIDCEDGKPTLLLNDTEKYTVKNISYGSFVTNVSLADQEILQDSTGCPSVDHNVTFAPGSWMFIPGMTVDYLVFFLRCSFTQLIFKPPTIDPITCGIFSGLTEQSFVLPKDQVPPGNWSEVCKQIVEVPVLKYKPIDPSNEGWRSGEYSQVLSQGFQLSWNDSGRPPHCKECEESTGRCGYSQAGEFLGCLCPDKKVYPLNCSASNLTVDTQLQLHTCMPSIWGQSFFLQHMLKNRCCFRVLRRTDL